MFRPSAARIGSCHRRAHRLPMAAAFAMLALAPVVGCGGAPEQAPSLGGFVPDTKPAPPIRWADATVPAGTRIELTLPATAGGEPPRVGDRLQARVATGVIAGSLLAIPEGSIVEGVVTAVTPGRPPTVAFRVVSTPTAASAAIAAHAVPASPTSGPPRGPGETPLTIVLDQPVSIKVRQ